MIKIELIFSKIFFCASLQEKLIFLSEGGFQANSMAEIGYF